MKKEMSGSITISDLKDGELIGFQLEDLIKKTDYYDKNDVNNLMDYRLDWRKTDAMFITIAPDNSNTIQLTLPLNSVKFRMRIFWNDNDTSLFISEPFEKQKTIEFTYSDHTPKTIAIIGEVGVYCTQGTILDITQFGTNVTLKSLGNMLSHLNASDKTLATVSALDSFKPSDLEVLDGYAFANIPLDKLPDNIETWDVSNVSSFKDLLAGRTDWNKNLSAWKTPHLNNVSNIFGQLTKLPFNILGWNFSNVIVGDALFKDIDLETIDIALLRFTQMMTADYMYQNVKNLVGFDFQPANNTSSITTAVGMFKGATLNNVTIDNDFRELIYADSMFENAHLTNCTINLTLPKCISAKNLFANATLTNCTINLTFTSLETLYSGLYGVTYDDATKISIDFGTGKVLANYLFANSNIKTINLNTFTHTSSILYADYMFENTINELNLSGFNLSGCISANGFIKNNILFNGNVSNLKFTNCMYLDSAFDGCSSFTGAGLEGWNCSSLSDIDFIFRNCTLLSNANAKLILNKTLTTMNYAFYNCDKVALTGVVDLPAINYMDYAFYNCKLSNIDLSSNTFNLVISMKSAFENNIVLTTQLPKFNPLNIEFDGLNRTFFGCALFNSSIPKLVIPKLTQMIETFSGCSEFNQPLTIIGEKITIFNSILQDCVKFNSSVEFSLPLCYIANYVFSGCLLFNKSISKISIGTSSPFDINLEGFLQNCKVFNQDVSYLPIARTISLVRTFYYCSALNQDLGSLPISIVTDMNRAFYYCNSVSTSNWANAKNWIMSHCTNLELTFSRCTYFNAQIGGWDISKVINLNSTFTLCTTFNQSLSAWIVTYVQNFNQTFAYCSALSGKSFATWNITLAKSINNQTDPRGQTINMFLNVGSGNTLPTGYAA